MQAPGQVQRGSGEGSKASGEGLGGVGSEAGQVKQGSEKVPEKVPKKEKVWEALVQSQVRFNRVPVPEKVPALGFAARFRKICKHKTLRLLGIPPKLIGNINPSRAGGLPAYPKSRNLYWNERPSMAFQMPAFCARRVIKKRLQCFSVSMTRT